MANFCRSEAGKFVRGRIPWGIRKYGAILDDCYQEIDGYQIEQPYILYMVHYCLSMIIHSLMIAIEYCTLLYGAICAFHILDQFIQR